MYDFLIGLSFDEAIAELEARGIRYDYESETIDEAREDDDLIVGGTVYSEIVWLPTFVDGRIVEMDEVLYCVD